MIVGFTGTKVGARSRKQVYTVIEILDEFRDNDSVFHHGCCIGWDDKAARIAKVMGYRLAGHPPVNRSKVGSVINDWDYLALPYIQRSHVMVDVSRILIAAPKTSYEVLRSGTWATIRYARKAGKPGFIVWPNGDLDSLLVPSLPLLESQ